MHLLKYFLSVFILVVFHFSSLSQAYCPTWEWAHHLGFPNPPNVELHDYTSDTTGNTYVVGIFTGSFSIGSYNLSTPDTTHFIAKFLNSTNTLAWITEYDVKQYGNTYSIPNTKIHYSEPGFLTVAGHFSDSATFGNHKVTKTQNRRFNNYISRFNVNTLQWEWAAKLDSRKVAEITEIQPDNIGNTYSIGTINNLQTANDSLSFGNQNLQFDTSSTFLIKLDSTGNWQWGKLLPFGNIPLTLAIDNNQNPTLGITHNKSFTFANQSASSSFGASILGYSNSGQEIWIKSITSNQAANWPIFTQISYDASNNLFAFIRQNTDTLQVGNNTVYQSSLQLIENALVAKLNAAKNWQWCKTIQGLNGGFNNNYVNADGSFYLLGGTSNGTNTIVNSDTLETLSGFIIMSLDQMGQYQWSGTTCPVTPNGNYGINPILGVSKQSTGSVTIAGFASGPVVFGSIVSSPGYFIARITPKNQVQLSIPKDTTLYCGENIQLKINSNSAAYFRYEWSPSTGLSDSTAMAPIASPDTTTTYTLKVYTKTGCFATDSITIFRDSMAPYPYSKLINIVTSSGNTQFCDNSNISLTTVENFSQYWWSTGDTAKIIFPNQPGTYKLVVQDTNGCYRTNQITLTAPAEIQNNSNLLCSGKSLTLSVNSNGLDSLRWNTGSNSAQLNVNNPGTYWVSVYKGSCAYTDSIDVVLFTDTANASFTDSTDGLEAHFAPNSIGVTSGVWYFGDGSYKTGVTATHTYAQPGTYNVCFESKDICGAEGRYCKNVTVTDIGLVEKRTIQHFFIYPNPANSVLNISSNEVLETELIIYNVSGGIVAQKNLGKNDHWQLDISLLPPGYYFIRIGSQASRFVKL